MRGNPKIQIQYNTYRHSREPASALSSQSERRQKNSKPPPAKKGRFFFILFLPAITFSGPPEKKVEMVRQLVWQRATASRRVSESISLELNRLTNRSSWHIAGTMPIATTIAQPPWPGHRGFVVAHASLREDRPETGRSPPGAGRLAPPHSRREDPLRSP